MTDKELLEGIGVKSDHAFRYLYRKTKPAIHRMVCKNSGHPDDADDVMQEAMVALWLNVSTGKYTLDGNSKLSTYLYSICRNLWLKRLRAAGRTVALESNPEPVAPDPPVYIDEQEHRINRLREHFRLLGDKCRRILSLFYYEKSAMKEIARELGYTESTAKNEKYRCMQRLRQMYDED